MNGGKSLLVAACDGVVKSTVFTSNVSICGRLWSLLWTSVRISIFGAVVSETLTSSTSARVVIPELTGVLSGIVRLLVGAGGNVG
jgi:hypothetical protein